jgi:ribosomal-protein-alanine N-acetyltransferase
LIDICCYNYRPMLTVNFNPFPTLYTSRLQLRQLTTGDVKEIFELRSNKTVMHFIDRPMAVTQDDALVFIQKITDNLHINEGITWAIAFKGEATLIGTIGFWRIDKENHRAEIGYMLQPQHHKKNIMHEAMVITLDYGLNSMRLHSVEANVNPANEASKKLLLKNNFNQEAYFKENYYFKGQFLDTVIYSLLMPLPVV